MMNVLIEVSRNEYLKFKFKVLEEVLFIKFNTSITL